MSVLAPLFSDSTSIYLPGAVGWEAGINNDSDNSSFFFFFNFCLAAPQGSQDLSSPARDGTPGPLQGKLRVLTTGPLGKSQLLVVPRGMALAGVLIEE